MTKDSLVDKCLGAAGIAIGMLACLVTIKSGEMILQRPSVAGKLEGLGRIALALPIGVFSLCAGYLLVRYPEIRKTNAADILRIAKRQKSPISPQWIEE